ncbi:MAG: acyl-CoA carboxylase epsilon subunit [Acidimicrobiia bacterium]
MAVHPVLRAISPDATPEEVAAIVAAFGALRLDQVVEPAPDDTLHEWVRTARLQSHRSGLRRGPWRLSGRVGRRTRV